MNAADLNKELEFLLALKNKILTHESLRNTELELECVDALFSNQVERLQREWEEAQLERIVGILFPQRNKKDNPIRWPGPKAFWWNSVSITRIERLEDSKTGERIFEVDLSSYVGNQNFDSLEAFEVPNAWLLFEDDIMVEKLHEICKAETQRLATIDRDAELKHCEYELATAQWRLAEIKALIAKGK